MADHRVPTERPDYVIIGKLEDLAFGGGSEFDDGYGAWNPRSCFGNSTTPTIEPNGGVIVQDLGSGTS